LLEKIASYLKVKYLYQETYESNQIANREKVEAISPKQISELSVQLIEELHLAISLGDVKEAYTILGKIQPEKELLANQLRNMVKNYLFPELLEILDLGLKLKAKKDFVSTNG
jgi:hypothetical protein